ncbi:glutathione S-transferase [Gluconacetobacter liquefaciens]|uniref:Glutathione S-transferase n=1 Tax=Gluconacetobacter liquefaciens TaxID=89584 RepID=A0A370G1X2_GLULI|nr:glutathione S-transferase family protein [Gluconacetobacter liquefaciens]MBB2186786.1 glutathione S-transferase family protein [Gluconacetobacter liquefaciens]RDI37798.1 glutathione S-transferase [Gluconacetobacter liquefaciens]GEB38908.1 glutathione S-transferase [Gluconacetobacter liquefaciens]
MSALVLYDDELDEDCYRARLFLSFLGLQARRVVVDVVPGGEQDSAAFRAVSPAGVLPVLRIEGQAVCGAEAVLLALAHGRAEWLPEGAVDFARVAHWLQFAGGPLRAAVLMRRASLFAGAGDEQSARRRAAVAALRIVEDHLAHRRLDGGLWVVGEGPTVADIALFPTVALCRDWGEEHSAYPALRRWVRAVRALPGFVTMPGIPDYG